MIARRHNQLSCTAFNKLRHGGFLLSFSPPEKTLIALATPILSREAVCALLHGDFCSKLVPMEQLFCALKQTHAREIGTPKALLDMVHEWKGMGENLLKSLVDCFSDIESREQTLSLVRESLEKRLKDLEERERKFNLFQEGKKEELKLREDKLDEQLKSVHEHIESLEVSQSEVEGLRLLECEKLKEIEKREREMDFVGGSLEKRLREVEKREKEFDSFHNGKLRELALKEELLSRKKKEFVEEVKLANEKLREKQKLGSGLIERLELALNMLEGMKVMMDERFKEIESWETVAQESLTASLNEADSIRESLEKRFKEFENIEKEFNLFLEDKLQKLESKEREIGTMRIELLKEVQLREEKLTEQQKSGHQFLECSEAMVAKKLKETESQDLTLNLTCETLDASPRDADLSRESANKRLQEFEKREEEFKLYQEKKLRELVLAEEKLRLIGLEFIQEIKFREKKFDKQENLVHGLLETLELAQNNVKDMNSMVSERFKEIALKEIELKYIRDWTKRKMDELGFKAKELDEQEKGIKSEEDVAISKENKLEEKKQELEFKQGSLGSWKKEHDYEEQHSEERDWGEKGLSSVREFPQTCLRENPALSNLHLPQRYLVEKHAGFIADKDQQQECRPREVELDRKLNDVHFKEHELKQLELTDALDAHLTIEPDESVDLKHALQMDGKTLEMLINGTEKDLELMEDEIFKILFLSYDPAKLVLDAVQGFYTPHLRKGNTEFKVRRAGILLLDQLTKMSPNIQPCVTEAAIKLALEWKSKMSTTAENPLEVLGFLHLLAAYNLSSYFDKNELFSFLKLVAQHKQTPELCRILGLTEKIPGSFLSPVLLQVLLHEYGFIQNLIKGKQYLLASTYIYECELENMFPQAAVLNYYVKHSKLLAKAKCRREHYSSEAQDKAIASEIADLRIAIDHIIKYGLESEYSPDALTARIKQIERNRASLRYEVPSSSADIQKQEKSKRSWDANKRKERQKQHEAAKESATISKSQMPQQGSESRSSPAWKAQHRQSKTEKHPATSPLGFQKPLDLVDEVPMTHPSSAHKRRRTNL